MIKAAAHSIYFKRKLNFGEGLVPHALDVLLKKEDKLLARYDAVTVPCTILINRGVRNHHRLGEDFLCAPTLTYCCSPCIIRAC